MTLPYPRHVPFFEMLYYGQRLGVVNDDRVAILDVKPGRVLEHHLFVDGFVRFRNFDRFALQRIVQLLRTGKEGGSSLDHAPSGLDAHGVHHQREGGEDFGDAAAVKGRADMDKVQRAKSVSFLQDSLNGRCTNIRFILFERMKTERGGLDGGCRVRHCFFGRDLFGL